MPPFCRRWHISNFQLAKPASGYRTGNFKIGNYTLASAVSAVAIGSLGLRGGARAALSGGAVTTLGLSSDVFIFAPLPLLKAMVVRAVLLLPPCFLLPRCSCPPQAQAPGVG